MANNMTNIGTGLARVGALLMGASSLRKAAKNGRMWDLIIPFLDACVSDYLNTLSDGDVECVTCGDRMWSGLPKAQQRELAPGEAATSNPAAPTGTISFREIRAGDTFQKVDLAGGGLGPIRKAVKPPQQARANGYWLVEISGGQTVSFQQGDQVKVRSSKGGR